MTVTNALSKNGLGYEPHLDELEHIQHVIQASHSILDLEDDWDDEGSPAYDEATLRRATDLLYQNAVELWKGCQLIVPAPHISPGPQGSIDLHWRTNSHELLVNIPPAEDEPATYYGDNHDGGVIKGTLNPLARNQWLMMWLMEWIPPGK